MLNDYITINFVPLAGLLFLVIFLLSNRKMDKKIRQIFLLLAGLELVELLLYSLELWTASFAKPTVWRILLSALGYGIRPVMIFFILQLAARTRLSGRKCLALAIPAFVNIAVVFSAFFTGFAFSYTEDNKFVRGPLGYVPHVVLLIYLICLVVLAVMESGKGRRLESVIVLTISLVIMLAVFLEAVYEVRSLGRATIVLATLVYYIYFQTKSYGEDVRGYMEQTIQSQKEHLREMNIIGVLAREYVTVCYVDVEKNVVTPYRMASFIEEHYGDILRSGVSFEKIFRAYVSQNILEEDRDFFLELADLQEMVSYLKTNGSLSRKYRVWRNGMILYCEMRAELVRTETGIEDIVFGFSNNDMRVRKEMVYQSSVQQEMNKVAEAKDSLAGIAELARQLQEAIEEKLSCL